MSTVHEPEDLGKDEDVETTELTAESSPRPRPRLAASSESTTPSDGPTPSDAPAKLRKKAAAPGVSAKKPIAARVLVMVLVVSLATLAWAGNGWWKQRQLETAHSEAVAAARQLAVNFVSISAATVDADLARIAAGATGDFGDEFGRNMPRVRQAVLENQVQSTGTVLRAGLVSGDDDSAVVLVAIDATVINVKAPDGRVSHYRMQFDLAKDGASGKWLVAKLQFVG
jgi:Mce-associated membrane protein